LFCCSFWYPISILSWCAYLIHPQLIIKIYSIIISKYVQINSTPIGIFQYIFITLIIVFIFSFLFYICIETPCHNYFGQVFNQNSNPSSVRSKWINIIYYYVWIIFFYSFILHCIAFSIVLFVLPSKNIHEQQYIFKQIWKTLSSNCIINLTCMLMRIWNKCIVWCMCCNNKLLENEYRYRSIHVCSINT
jgi:hypothetical protein